LNRSAITRMIRSNGHPVAPLKRIRMRHGFRVLTAALLAGLVVAAGRSAPAGPQREVPQVSGLSPEKLSGIPALVEDAIRRGQTPGAVVLIGHRGKVVYQKAFGHRALVPQKLPMTVDTIFDLASLTKVIATTTAAMQLFEQGKIRLDDPVTTYWPEFGSNGKEHITIRELMTHYSGLPPDLDLKAPWSGYETAMRMIVGVKPIVPPGTRFIYSDINFETMGELVRRISGEPLDVYCASHIFGPLGMNDTFFRPLVTHPEDRNRIAPTQHQFGTTGKILWGEVHDPTSYRMGGVAGHAGLFSTAHDLAIFAQMLLNGGSYKGVRLLSPLTIEKMTLPQSPPDAMALRGLGWDIGSPYATNRGELLPVGSYGHTGFTGTSIWIDPVTQTYIIILTNRVHPDGKGDVVPLRTKIATLVAAALGPISNRQVLESRKSLTDYEELMRGYRVEGLRNGKVETGIDVLEAEAFAPLKGLRIGLLTNLTGRDSRGRRTIDLLRDAPDVKLVALFSPEHGLYENMDAKVASSTDPQTRLPVYSLYGDVQRPTDQMLRGLDAVVFDIQDAGVRFYTYITTLGYVMEAAAKKGIAVYVLDRPNPLGGTAVEGPMLDPGLKSFVGYYPLPVRHGMTMGELAEMFNRAQNLGVKLHVIKMRGWERSDWFDETGLAWVNPSPNLRSLTEATLYPGVAMVEGSNVSVGRGTDTPFELLGAPWMVGAKLAEYLNERRIQGVRFLPMDFQPSSSRYQGEVCHGVQIFLVDRQALDSPELGVELAAALHELFPTEFKLDETLPLMGSRQVVEAIRAGGDPRAIALHWQESLQEFRQNRAKYLLY
jgi:uncharacterized protein YbbC (DUF1343 family)/CubicO group peptidase (beta-lactamase class C family)